MALNSLTNVIARWQLEQFPSVHGDCCKRPTARRLHHPAWHVCSCHCLLWHAFFACLHEPVRHGRRAILPTLCLMQGAASTIFQSMPSLQCIVVEDCDALAACACISLFALPRLEHLEFIRCDGGRLLSRLAPSERAALLADGAMCPQLVQLRISFGLSLTTDRLRRLLSHFPSLRALELDHPGSVQLQHDTLVGTPGLTRVSLVECKSVAEGACRAVALMSGLVELDLSACGTVTDTSLAFLVGLSCRQELCEQGPSLCVLRLPLSWCPLSCPRPQCSIGKWDSVTTASCGCKATPLQGGSFTATSSAPRK